MADAPRGGRRPRGGEHRVVHASGEGPHQRGLRGGTRGGRACAAARRRGTHLPARPPRAARPAPRTPRRKPADVPPSVQWLLDSMTLSAAWVNNARLDALAINPLGRALYSAMFTRLPAAGAVRANFARYNFLDPGAQDLPTPTGTAPLTPPSRCSEPKPDGTHTTRPCVTWSVSCPRSAPRSAPAGRSTTSACTTPASNGSAAPTSAPSNSPMSRCRCPCPSRTPTP